MLSAALVKEKAKQIGFTLVGITGDIEARHVEFNDWWLASGHHASMHFLERQKERRRSIRNILPTAESVVVCALRFPGGAPEPRPLFQSAARAEAEKNDSYLGKVARYASGRDYHEEILAKLTSLAAFIDESSGLAAGSSLAYADTGALNERALAAQAGLGWVGKNAMLIHPEEGSWMWLGEVLTSVRLQPDLPLPDRCGTCTKCMDACPTSAIIPGKRAVDSQRCIAFLTIEQRGEIAPALQAPIGDWLLGCDICQEVCPWNNASLRHGRKSIGAPEPEYLSLETIEGLDVDTFRAEVKKTALSRPKLEGLKRNAKIVRKNIDAKLGSTLS